MLCLGEMRLASFMDIYSAISKIIVGIVSFLFPPSNPNHSYISSWWRGGDNLGSRFRKTTNWGNWKWKVVLCGLWVSVRVGGQFWHSSLTFLPLTESGFWRRSRRARKDRGWKAKRQRFEGSLKLKWSLPITIWRNLGGLSSFCSFLHILGDMYTYDDIVYTRFTLTPTMHIISYIIRILYKRNSHLRSIIHRSRGLSARVRWGVLLFRHHPRCSG